MNDFKSILAEKIAEARNAIEFICVNTLRSDFETSDEIEQILERVFSIRADLEEIDENIKEL